MKTPTDIYLILAGTEAQQFPLPPKAAAHINRELIGSYLDRILISFHSNASSGKARGAVALFNASANKRPSYQEDLAEHIGVQVNAQMVAEESPTEQKWTERERHTYSGINFGELRRDYVQNEMCATIVETAFHDNREDVDFLLDPEARIQMAEATLRGIFHWYADIVNSNAAEEMPPSRPLAVAATVKEGKIQVKWKLGPVGKYDGSPAVRVRIARSANGYGFDGGELEDAEAGNATIDPITTSGVTFIRVTALNGAGESFPSQTIAVGLSKGSKSADNPKSLHIAANTILDRSTDVPYDLGKQVGGPYKNSAETVRVRAVYAMTEPSGVAEALALNDLGQAFDGADSAAYEAGLVDRNVYKRVFFTTEQQNPRKPIFSEALENQVRSLLNRNGKIYISGSGYVANLTNNGSKHKTFLNNILGITGEETGKTKATIQSMDDRFFPTSGTLDLQANNRFWGQGREVQPSSLKLRKGRSLGLIKYVRGVNETGIAAALTRPSYSEGEIISLGFPMSLIKDRDTRKHLMQAILKQL